MCLCLLKMDATIWKEKEIIFPIQLTYIYLHINSSEKFNYRE